MSRSFLSSYFGIINVMASGRIRTLSGHSCSNNIRPSKLTSAFMARSTFT